MAFEPYTFSWEGKDYTVPQEKRTLCCAAVESRISFFEVCSYLANPLKTPVSQVAMGFAALLRYCGREVSDQDVHRGMFGDAVGLEVSKRTVIALNALYDLLSLNVPPESLKLQERGGGGAGKGSAAGKRAGSSRSSTSS